MPEMMARVEAEDFDTGLPPDGPPPGSWSASRPRVVVVGGGFAGLRAVRQLGRVGVEVTLVYGVADLSAANVWAVGYIRPFASQTTSTLIMHWNGASWGIAASTTVPGTLRAISAASATDIWAVGDDAHGHAAAYRYDGTTWSPVALPAGASGTLTGVKAFGPGDVWAVGFSAAGQTLVLHWNGSA